MATPRPKKREPDGKAELIKFRLSTDEKEAFQQAAGCAGISMSAWMRERLRSAAIRELEAARIPVPFLKHLYGA